MKYRAAGFFCALVVVGHLSPVAGETVRLKSGREVEIIDGLIPDKVAAEIVREVASIQEKGQLELASEYWHLLAEKAKGPLAAQAAAVNQKLATIEQTSYIRLRNGKVATGKIQANLRADLLGLEGKGIIPLWQIEEIVAEYHPGYSAVSKTYYPLTLLEIRFRSGERRAARTMAEIEFAVNGADGSLSRMVLGHSYEILRPQSLGEQIDAKTQGRIMKIVIYPDLKKLK